MLRLLTLIVTMTNGRLRSRSDLILENLALRQQLAALAQKHSRSCLAGSDRVFWVRLQRFRSGCKVHLFSCSRRRSSLDIAPGLSCAGSGFHVNIPLWEGGRRPKNGGSPFLNV